VNNQKKHVGSSDRVMVQK